jgi:hypothetical protein
LLAYFLMLRAEAELGMEHWAEAEDDFRRAIEIDPMLRKRLEPLIADARFRKGAL